MSDEDVEHIVAGIGDKFRTFGGDKDPGNNPIAHAMMGRPLSFAANVDVAEVVRFVIAAMPSSAAHQKLLAAARAMVEFYDDGISEEAFAVSNAVREALAAIDKPAEG